MSSVTPPRIVIVGRPNVGKSTLLNRFVGSRVAIVEPTAGVTRDRISVTTRIDTPWGERSVEVIDTGGIGIVDRDDLGPRVEEQIQGITGIERVTSVASEGMGVVTAEILAGETTRSIL